MDWQEFYKDVRDDINAGNYTASCGVMATTGIEYFIGETWQGALYGFSETIEGTQRFSLFESEGRQQSWLRVRRVDSEGKL